MEKPTARCGLAKAPYRLLIVAGLAAALLPADPARAQPRAQPHEVAMLPPYCQSNGLVTPDANPVEGENWKRRLGAPYRAIHHYCWALISTNRARIFAKTRLDKMRGLQASIGDFDFMLRYTPPDYMLLPEILTKRGENMVDLGRTAEGVRDLQGAIKAKPDYWPPYAVLSDHFKNAGDKTKAREILEQGLSNAPDAKALRTRLAELGGSSGATRQPGDKAVPAPSAKPATATPAPKIEGDEATQESRDPPQR